MTGPVNAPAAGPAPEPAAPSLRYDPQLRRDTPLARALIARIRADGPLRIDAYMDACLNDPTHGYYRTRAAIGRAGDFITAPEISQVFGELLGLWCVVAWQRMGAPAMVALIELGAGRGALLADALRAARIVPAFRAALEIHIVDANPMLMREQQKALADCGLAITWHTTLTSLPSDMPSLWIANEFLDTFPVLQSETSNGRTAWRAVGLDPQGSLTFVTLADPAIENLGLEGTLDEAQNFDVIVAALKARDAAAQPFCALFIDYGQPGPSATDTLQAVRDHHHEHPLTSPGEADLSCQVCFGDFAEQVTTQWGDERALAIDGPVVQAEFLGELGIMERASRLMAANPTRANELETGVARLMAPRGMGTRFMALGVRSPHLPPLPGFGKSAATKTG